MTEDLSVEDLDTRTRILSMYRQSIASLSAIQNATFETGAAVLALAELALSPSQETKVNLVRRTGTMLEALQTSQAALSELVAKYSEDMEAMQKEVSDG